MFDKVLYWKRRRNEQPVLDKKGKPTYKKVDGKKVPVTEPGRPLRGQGDKPRTKVGFTPATEYKPEPKKLSKKAIKKNTKRARKAAA